MQLHTVLQGFKIIIRLLTKNSREQAVGGRLPIFPHQGLQVVTQYTSYTHLDLLLTRCPCWPASTANQSGLVTLTLTLKVVSQSCVTWVTSANFGLPRPLCS